MAHAGVDVEEKRYNFIGANWDRSEWLNEKFTFGFDFPNVSKCPLRLRRVVA